MLQLYLHKKHLSKYCHPIKFHEFPNVCDTILSLLYFLSLLLTSLQKTLEYSEQENEHGLLPFLFQQNEPHTVHSNLSKLLLTSQRHFS